MDDISIYTYEEDKPLIEIFELIFDKESGGKCISHKESANKLTEYLQSVVPNYDEERVYISDVKKIFQWYNLVMDAGLLTKEDADTTDQASAEVLEEAEVVEETSKKASK